MLHPVSPCVCVCVLVLLMQFYSEYLGSCEMVSGFVILIYFILCVRVLKPQSVS